MPDDDNDKKAPAPAPPKKNANGKEPEDVHAMRTVKVRVPDLRRRLTEKEHEEPDD